MAITKSSSNKVSRIGILGGTFDPIHKGHIEPAKQVFTRFNLDKILVIPAHKPPHKSDTMASTRHRVNMVELTCINEKAFELDIRETKRDKLSYTLDTILELKAENPNSELFFIMGMDSLLNFTRWHLWQDILQTCHLIVNTRPGYDLTSVNADTRQLLAQHQASISQLQQTSCENFTYGNIFLNEIEELDISSTELRQYIANQVDCSKWLTTDTIEYIKDHNLYSNI